MSIVTEFREFAVKGNAADLAIGVVIGAAFGKIVSSIVADLVMPPLGLIVGGANFSNLKLVLRDAAGDQPAVTLNYGTFLQTVFDFLIIAIAVFSLVKTMNRLKRREEAAPPAPAPPSKEEVLLTEIRDAIREKH